MLAAERVWIGSFLDLRFLETVGGEPAAACRARLIDYASERGRKDLPHPREGHGCFRECDAGIVPQFGVGSQQQPKLLFYRHGKWIDAAGRYPLGLIGIFRGE